MIKSKFGDRLDGWLRRLLPCLVRRRLNPNVLTVIGALICLVAAVAFSAGWIVTGGFLMLAGGAFDLLDGLVARSHGITTRFGAFLDSTLDRVVDMALLLGIAMHYVFEGEPGLVLLAGYVLATSVLVSYTQARAELVLPSFRGLPCRQMIVTCVPPFVLSFHGREHSAGSAANLCVVLAAGTLTVSSPITTQQTAGTEIQTRLGHRVGRIAGDPPFPIDQVGGAAGRTDSDRSRE